jgi:hypothetical protein
MAKSSQFKLKILGTTNILNLSFLIYPSPCTTCFISCYLWWVWVLGYLIFFLRAPPLYVLCFQVLYFVWILFELQFFLFSSLIPWRGVFPLFIYLDFYQTWQCKSVIIFVDFWLHIEIQILKSVIFLY